MEVEDLVRLGCLAEDDTVVLVWDDPITGSSKKTTKIASDGKVSGILFEGTIFSEALGFTKACTGRSSAAFLKGLKIKDLTWAELQDPNTQRRLRHLSPLRASQQQRSSSPAALGGARSSPSSSPHLSPSALTLSGRSSPRLSFSPLPSSQKLDSENADIPLASSDLEEASALVASAASSSALSASQLKSEEEVNHDRLVERMIERHAQELDMVRKSFQSRIEALERRSNAAEIQTARAERELQTILRTSVHKSEMAKEMEELKVERDALALRISELEANPCPQPASVSEVSVVVEQPPSPRSESQILRKKLEACMAEKNELVGRVAEANNQISILRQENTLLRDADLKESVPKDESERNLVLLFQKSAIERIVELEKQKTKKCCVVQ